MKGRAWLLVLALCAMVGACKSPRPADGQSTAAAPRVQPVTMPDIGRNPPVVQQQLRDAYAALMKPAPGAEDYGRVGIMFMAAEYFAEAEVALQDAEALAPSDMRWPYYLGHLYRMRGVTDKSAAAFERAVAANATYAPALVYLGNAYLDQGRPEAAEPLFAKALMQQPRLVAALFGLGRAALARHDYAAAITNLEQAIAIDPQAAAVHYPLGLAYRGAGQLDQAQVHLKAGVSGGEVKPPDPTLDEMNAALESSVAYEVRGARALDQGQWDTAVQLFQRGVDLAPGEPSLRHKLGTALAMKGDRAGAFRAFQETARRSPTFAKAHYSLALMYAERGDIGRAVAALSTALRVQPNYVEAHLQLAELLRHTGRPDEALAHYRAALDLDPRLAEAQYGVAMTSLQRGRYRDARDRLADGLSRHPDRPGFAVALARVLAAAPDDQVRDGARAIQLLQGVPADTQRTFDWGVAMAMALAETGRYADAARWQRQAIGFSQDDPRLTRRLTETLHLYEQERPCRRPWSDADPMDLVDRPFN
jgi:tetratricopeptide (TPR) repeat protein